MKVKNSRFSITLPVLGSVKVEKLPNLGWKDPWKEAYAILGEVDGERKGALVIAVENLNQPVQIRDLKLNYSNIIWMPTSELELPIDEGLKVNFPLESLNWNRLVEIFAITYSMNTLLHEFLHLWVHFESKEVDEILGAESEEFYNIVEDFLIQVMLLKKAKECLAFKPSWITSKQQLIAINSPSFMGKMHTIKVLQGIGCQLSKVEVLPYKNGESMNVTFHFSEPCLNVNHLELTHELIATELVAYTQILTSQRFTSQGYVKLDIKLPALIQNILNKTTEESESHVLQDLAARFVEFGNAFVRKWTLKPFESLYENLVDFLTARLIKAT